MKRKLSSFIGFFVIIFGLGLILYPDLKTCCMDWKTTSLIREFKKNILPDDENPDSRKESGGAQASDNILHITEALWNGIRDYNDRIFADGQAGFRDAWSVTQSPDLLAGLEDGMFGYIEIPAMDVTLPMYIGASAEHMAKGVAILGETSIPIGGSNTNSVIAGHRGYRGAPFFRDIEKLSIGDSVYINNPWETLTYRVESIEVIEPDSSDVVKIQEGKDMVTLLTCHPYRSHGKYRYVVFCIRDEGMTAGSRDPKETQASITASDGGVYVSSQNEIQIENLIRKCGALMIIAIICFTLCRKNKKERKI